MRIKRFNCALLSALVIASIVTLAITLLSSRPVHAGLTQHAPIYINGNSGFTKPNPVNGGGSGTVSNPYIIENYIINASSATGITLSNTTAYFVIRNCLFENGEGYYSGIYLDNVINGRIENNVSLHNKIGIFLSSSSSNILSHNTCSNNLDNGISIYSSSDYNTLDKNILENNSDIAIYVYSSSYERIVNNSTSNNFTHSIYLRFSSYDNLINNSCHNNHQEGIYLADSSSHNRIIANNCSNNSTEGISLDNSDYNTITLNYLLNNKGYNAHDDGINYWDNGYPSGGNYWSDYKGSDNYRGENQNIPGSDGIGDTPYYIPGGSNLDRYPLRMLGLVAGWNLVGFTSLGDNNTPANIFAGLTYLTDYIIYYWRAPTGPYTLVGQNEVFKDNVGYWVWINQDNMVTTNSWLPPTCDVSLVAGWNLVSFPIVNENTTPNKMFTGLTYMTDYIIYYWNAPSGPYGLQGGNQLPTGNLGYWVWINQDWTVTVP